MARVEERIARRDFQNFRNITADDGDSVTTQLNEKDLFVEGQVATAYGTVTLNLPPVGRMAGKIVSVTATSVANSKHIYVLAHRETGLGNQDGDDPDIASIDLDTTEDYVILYSNGRRWIVLASEMA